MVTGKNILMKCPKCSHEQENKIECESCGIIFQKYIKLVFKKNFSKAKNLYENNEIQQALDIFKVICNTKIQIDNSIRLASQEYIDKINNTEKLSSNPIQDKNSSKRDFLENKQLLNKHTIIGLISFLTILLIATGSFYFLNHNDDYFTMPFDEVIAKAESDNINAQYALGMIYYNGLSNTETDHKEAVRWLKKASQADHSKAQAQLGMMYYKGIGVPQSYVKAEKMLSRAVEKDDPLALQTLGNMYLKGKGVIPDEQYGLTLLMKASALDSPESNYILGLLYEEGSFVDKSEVESNKYYEKSFNINKKMHEQGDTTASFNLARHYYLGKGVEQNTETAMMFTDQAVAKNNLEAKIFLASILIEKENKTKDADLIVKIVEMLMHIEDPSPEVQYMLGVTFSKIHDFYNAIVVYEKASERNHAKANFNLGVIYWNGDGDGADGKDNKYKAKDYFDKALSLGLEEAREPARKAGVYQSAKTKKFKDQLRRVFGDQDQIRAEREAKCERECALNNYQYNKKCKFSCMQANGWW